MIRIRPDSKLYIWGSTPEVRTGGAEVISMLASTLKSYGADCTMFNWFMEQYKQADYYASLYDVNCGTWMDLHDDEKLVILIPDATVAYQDNLGFFLHDFPHAQFIFWWLGSGLITRPIANKLKAMESHSLNLCESTIAKKDLEHYGVKNTVLFQHGTNKVFYERTPAFQKTDTIMFNAFKESTLKMMHDVIIPSIPEEYKDRIKFEGVYYRGPENFLSKEELCDMYDRSKLYIDFADFAGRELMPREACLRKCVLLLANEGNASTFDEYPIPDEYKISRYDDPKLLWGKIIHILDNYESVIDDFTFFRNKCMYEPMKWDWSIRNIFGPMLKTENL